VTGASTFVGDKGRFEAHGLLSVTPSAVGSGVGIAGDIALGRSDTSAYLILGADGLANISRSGGSGATVLSLNSTSVSVAGNLVVEATNKLYLDSGSNTYISESSADLITFTAAGATSTMMGSNWLAVPATAKFYLDGGGDTYIVENSADSMQLVTGSSVRWWERLCSCPPRSDLRRLSVTRRSIQGLRQLQN
jgi:hypothetical protein